MKMSLGRYRIGQKLYKKLEHYTSRNTCGHYILRNSSNVSSRLESTNCFRPTPFQERTYMADTQSGVSLSHLKGSIEQDNALEKIKRGDIVNLSELLFTADRDYLIKCDGQLVKAEHLCGKIVVILFGSISGEYYECVRNETKPLLDVYNILQPKDDFEVVFVPFGDPPGEISPPLPVAKKHWQRLCDLFSHMPWPAVPFSDKRCRDQLLKRFDISRDWRDTSLSFIFDSSGKLLRVNAFRIFDYYGPLAYPFSDEKIDSLDSEWRIDAKEPPSLGKFLTYGERNYVISNKNEKVLLSTLEDKVVALYFYAEGEANLTKPSELKKAYRKFKNQGFEVVLFYLNDIAGCTESTFWKTFKRMPWLAIPFDDPIQKKLKVTLNYSYTRRGVCPSLVIFGPRGKFFDPFGGSILWAFNSVYPFTREKIVELYIKEFKELKLESIWDPDTIFRGEEGSQVRFSQLAGKNVILIFERRRHRYRFNFLKPLRKLYVESKGTDREFEVIFIKCYHSCQPHYLANKFDREYMPWLVHPFDENHPLANEFVPDILIKRYFTYGLRIYQNEPMALAFDENGMLVRETLCPSIKKGVKFPFYDGGLEKEALFQLNKSIVRNFGYL